MQIALDGEGPPPAPPMTLPGAPGTPRPLDPSWRWRCAARPGSASASASRSDRAVRVAGFRPGTWRGSQGAALRRAAGDAAARRLVGADTSTWRGTPACARTRGDAARVAAAGDDSRERERGSVAGDDLPRVEDARSACRRPGDLAGEVRLAPRSAACRHRHCGRRVRARRAQFLWRPRASCRWPAPADAGAASDRQQRAVARHARRPRDASTMRSAGLSRGRCGTRGVGRRPLLDGDGLGQVARLVDVVALGQRDRVAHELQRQHGQERLQRRRARRGSRARARTAPRSRCRPWSRSR